MKKASRKPIVPEQERDANPVVPVHTGTFNPSVRRRKKAQRSRAWIEEKQDLAEAAVRACLAAPEFAELSDDDRAAIIACCRTFASDWVAFLLGASPTSLGYQDTYGFDLKVDGRYPYIQLSGPNFPRGSLAQEAVHKAFLAMDGVIIDPKTLSEGDEIDVGVVAQAATKAAIEKELDSFAETKKPRYNKSIMDEAAKACKPAADYFGLPVEVVTETLAELRAKAARETTARAKAEPRPGIEAKLHPESVALPSVEPAGKSSRRYTHHVFTEKELRDPETVNRSLDTLADVAAAYRDGAKITEEQRQAAARAKAFLRKVRHLDAA